MGWDTVVAPLNSASHQGDPHGFDRPPLGDVPKLPGRGDASYEMAPSLPAIIRQTLQGREVSPENIDLYLSKQKNLGRYDRAFRKLWAFCTMQGGDPTSMSCDEVAGWLLRLNEFHPHEARNAYAGLILVPGWEGLRFSQIVKECKQDWNSSIPKYGDFWDARQLLLRLESEPLRWHDVRQVRDRCILLLRILHLCRSIDLARCFRKTSIFQGSQYFWLHRKGRRRPQWEPLMTLPGRAAISPSQVLNTYVRLTSAHAPSGSKVFRALRPPYQALSAGTIGKITKQVLQRLGIPTSVFGAHSTRGAAVKMFKTLGLPS